ncbi:MAG: PTPA-CTERM sorting domain-containing protein [Cyanobacteria bacterium Co-bin8]|nr:PTPA-CTERM sorting domain-containing protein [Cyanobacteria bacterium Co-bin8]
MQAFPTAGFIPGLSISKELSGRILPSLSYDLLEIIGSYRMVRKQLLSMFCLSILSTGAGLVFFSEIALAVANDAPQNGAQDYRTGSPTNGSRESSSNLVGQPFTVGSEDITLESFSFRIRGSFNNSQPMTFTAYVSEWTAAGPTGEILHTSTIQTKAADEKSEQFSFAANMLELKANKSYVVFVTVNDFGGSTSLEIENVEFKASRKSTGGSGGGGGGGGGGGKSLQAITTLASPLIGYLLSSSSSNRSSQSSKATVSETVARGSLPNSKTEPEGPQTPNPENPSVGKKPEDPTPDPTPNPTPDPRAVPTPALLPGLIGMGAKLWTKRKAEVLEPGSN